MKRLMLLTVVAAVTAATVGCGNWGWWRRGPQCETCPPACSANPYAPGATVTPGAVGETYLPAPG